MLHPTMLLQFAGTQWLPLIVNTGLQSLIVATIAILLTGIARRSSAASRHLLLTGALVAMLSLPLLAVVGRSRHGVTRSYLAQQAHRMAPAAPLPQMVGTVTPRIPAPASGNGAVTQSSLPALRTVERVLESNRIVTERLRHSWSGILFMIWLTVSALLMARLIVGWMALLCVKRRAETPSNEDLNQQISRLARESGVMRRVITLQVAHGDRSQMPMTWGLWRPVLLLPADAEHWSEEKLRSVVLHELAHVRRNDWLTQVLGQLACCVYWFNPLVWLLQRYALIEAERACDDAVLLAGVPGTNYAAHLLDIVHSARTARRQSFQAVSMAQPTQVTRRMQAILDPRRRRRAMTRSSLAAIMIGIGVLLLAVTSLRPLALETRASAQAVASVQAMPEVSPPTAPSILLPDGVLVELAGIGSSRMGEEWWSMDGKPLLSPPRDTNNVFHRTFLGIGTQYMTRALFFRLSSRRAADVSTTGYVVDPAQQLQRDGYHFGRDLRLEGPQLRRNEPATGVVEVPFPPAMTHCTYRFGLASGPWQTVAVTRIAFHPTPEMVRPSTPGTYYGVTLWLNDQPGLSYEDRNGKSHRQSLLGGNPKLGDVARRVIALDKEGQEVPLDSGRVDYHGDHAIEISPGTLARIDKIRLETRPYQWAEFKDIVLTAPRFTRFPSIAPPPPLPGYRHTFSNGLRLTLSAVTERRADGGRWWQPNGALLSGPLKDYEKMVQFQGWPETENPRALLFEQASTHTVMFSSATQFIPNSGVIKGVRHGASEAGVPARQVFQSSLNQGYPPGVEKCTVRYGIASGPWHPVATLSMPQNVKRHNGSPNSYDGDITLILGDRPRMTYEDTSGQKFDQPFVHSNGGRIGNVARRFVAIDRNGKEITLQCALTGTDYDAYPLTYRDIGNLHQYNPIDLTQIREFRLQTRHYEWAEFQDIRLRPHGALARR